MPAADTALAVETAAHRFAHLHQDTARLLGCGHIPSSAFANHPLRAASWPVLQGTADSIEHALTTGAPLCPCSLAPATRSLARLAEALGALAEAAGRDESAAHVAQAVFDHRLADTEQALAEQSERTRSAESSSRRVLACVRTLFTELAGRGCVHIPAAIVAAVVPGGASLADLHNLARLAERTHQAFTTATSPAHATPPRPCCEALPAVVSSALLTLADLWRHQSWATVSAAVPIPTEDSAGADPRAVEQAAATVHVLLATGRCPAR